MRVEVLLAGATAPEPLPVHDLVEADLWDQLPADLYLQDEMQVAFHPTLTPVWCRKGRRGQCLVEAPGDNRHPSMALVWWTGAIAGAMAALLQDAPRMCDVAQVCAAVARSKQRGRVAIVIADNLRTRTPAGSLLVCSLLSEFKAHLYLVYTPAYDPDANRIEWLWRVSRRVVAHNHHRSIFELLLMDVEKHFQATFSDSRRDPSSYRQSGRPQTRFKMLLCHLLRPHNHLASLAYESEQKANCRRFVIEWKGKQ